MRQARAEMIASPVKEHLCLIFQPAKGPRMDDPRAIALKLGAEIVTRLRIFSSARVIRFLREGLEGERLGRLHLFPALPALPGNASITRIIFHREDYSSLRGLCESGVTRAGCVEFFTL